MYKKPSPFEAAFNKSFGFLIALGFGLPHNYLVQVKGRKSGKTYSNPIDLLEYKGKRYLVAPRGRTQWVRNAEVAGEVVLKKGFLRRHFRLRLVDESEKPELLKAYLERFRLTVQRYFPLRAGSPVQDFDRIANDYPVFELLPL
jgi:deazaflavin-dependent oxidoreductase (nitroreductase family)